MWFSKSIEESLKEFNVDASLGLSEEESGIRLKKYGVNKLQAKKKKSLLKMFIAQLNDWLIYILFAAVLITLFLNEYIDATIILLVIFTNAALGVAQQIKANRAIEALRRLAFPKALVRRNGIVKEIDSDLIVPGDIISLDAGRLIAADLRLIESANLQIDESTLTGESVSSSKDASLIHDDLKTPLGDRANTAFMSTLVTRGRGIGLVVGTGMNTEMGKIANLIISEKKSKTLLEIRLDQLGKILGEFAIGICVLIFMIAMIQGRDLAEMFLMSVSLAVAAIPEGLAAIVAVVLSIGVTALSKKNAIVKKLPAVETLGSVNMICSDKTGTLTQNKMTVTTFYNLEGEVPVERNAKNIATADAGLLAKAMILSSDATLEEGHATGDPTEIALLILGDDLGIDRKVLNENSKRINEFSFDSDRKLMSTLVGENSKYTVYTKGAIAGILLNSTHVRFRGEVIPITDVHREQYRAAANNMANKALRTLGVAYKPAGAEIQASEMEQNLVLTGLVGMIDPPRPEVRESIQKAKIAGITTLMITGDHKNTAYAIASELEIAEDPGQVITGHEIDDLTDKEFAGIIEQYRVFARVSPEHKVKIVRALKSLGNVVSMTGDGVNDAPSLHAADIGVAMGITGTDVAKGASDMILADDNFATIVTAIGLGRNIYNNIRKTVIFLLTCNLGEVVTIFVAILIGWSAPLIATQLLWINLLTDTFPAIALGMDPGNQDVMNEKPRDAKESFFAGGGGLHILMGGLLIGALTTLAFCYGYYEHGFSPFDDYVPKNTLDYARTMAFLVLVFSQLFFSLAIRHNYKSIFQIGVFSNIYLTGAIVLGVLLQMIILVIPITRSAFHLQMPDLKAWILVVSFGLVPLLFNEVIKIFIRARLRNQRA